MKINIFNEYVNRVCGLYGIKEQELFKKTKVREIVDARHLLYYLCFKRPMKIIYIKTFMSERGYDIGHSSISHGIQLVTKLQQDDADYKRFILGLQNAYEFQ